MSKAKKSNQRWGKGKSQVTHGLVGLGKKKIEPWSLVYKTCPLRFVLSIITLFSFHYYKVYIAKNGRCQKYLFTVELWNSLTRESWNSNHSHSRIQEGKNKK